MNSKSDPSAYQWALLLIIAALVLAVLGEFSAQVRGAELVQPSGPDSSYSDPLTYIPNAAARGPT